MNFPYTENGAFFYRHPVTTGASPQPSPPEPLRSRHPLSQFKAVTT